MKTIGILSPGDMGHTVGQRLKSNGLRVVAQLADRSARTRQLAAKVGIEEVSSYDALVGEADIVLCILVPAEAGVAAQKVADALRSTGADLLYADCNAIAPQTTIKMGETITDAGGRFVDASIIGPPPRREGATRFYASGVHAKELAQLEDYGLEVPVISDRVGDASAIKMCYAGLTKGLTALCTELLVAAEALGIREALFAEYNLSQAAMLKRIEGGLPGMPPKSRRWVGEMEEISATMAGVGMTGKFHDGAADIYRFIGDSTLADRTPEDPDAPTLEEMLQLLVCALPAR
jgi:3-hydroxyisobutyrate dehydrogenase-like beta-hydroxyacid dehydrogenase